MKQEMIKHFDEAIQRTALNIGNTGIKLETAKVYLQLLVQACNDPDDKALLKQAEEYCRFFALLQYMMLYKKQYPIDELVGMLEKFCIEHKPEGEQSIPFDKIKQFNEQRSKFHAE